MQKTAPKGPKAPHKGQNPRQNQLGKKKNPNGLPQKPRGGFWGNLTSIILIFVTIMLLYSFIVERQEKTIRSGI